MELLGAILLIGHGVIRVFQSEPAFGRVDAACGEILVLLSTCGAGAWMAGSPMTSIYSGLRWCSAELLS